MSKTLQIIFTSLIFLSLSVSAEGLQPEWGMSSRATAQAQIAGQWGEAYIARRCGYVSDTELRQLGERLKKQAASNQISRAELKQIATTAAYRMEEDFAKLGCEGTQARESSFNVKGFLASQ